ncbi:MAG: dUTPase [Sulfurimonas sp. RIFOXYD12_FULL_33_39]|uniref:dUTP diphosphatase n=1 Tax=unclassified Sulfurimonas TaxID=2623549 RepID=UPI0008C0FC4E|nr:MULTISPECIES: dUTP diphosphatase [unclassified Sulfurimonas]OHE01422.1 MAG: dUTPase [Sulfurimonas sp. RIFCSPLOWO2_12_FULL_34_6]OHE08781.1 MAG: dUTPase [Sulfurimonas sp. RIFOXYD12_FULL_33_39]OHE14066.1 MAG: dUTPase [Sulfurimonas sp. RIFOXYD2_FULL_34_21]DAB27528.1 MAG TPA: dUTPase [Sulfurimonas sp. UBA10385]
MDKILLMLQLQASLNDATNGEKWTEGITKNGKVINWKRCIYMECAEMIESFSWKHWKNIEKEPDWDNLQIEVVDVWHFIMSLAIENYSKTLRGGIEDLAIDISESDNFVKIDTQNELFALQDDVINKIESIMYDVLSKGELSLEKLIADFFDLVLMSGLDLESLYKLYVGKNILNQFRQDHGYKDGSYIKVWAGEEDNVVMKRVWEENGDIKPNELYKELTKLYLALNKS